ncbi:MAG: metallophosphoesterase [Lysobacteraceae bacterium]|nr:MAG: metallophosphoesterase [Xanthomonadaceae bacterium]
MRLALLADLHANREATEACVSKLRKLGFDRMVILGDIVGYGADPEWTVDTAQRMVADGAIAVHGNHDEAIWSPRGDDAPMHSHAQAAVAWTRDRLSASQVTFLSQLPVSVDDDDRLYVHANAWAPKQWGYVANELAAAKSMAATAMRVTFCGHVHEPALYHSQSTGGARHFSPTPGIAVPLIGSRRWLALPGSVGQPRDGHAAACCALYDTARHALTLLRVAYDHHAAARKITQAGLPQALAQRLIEGC